MTGSGSVIVNADEGRCEDGTCQDCSYKCETCSDYEECIVCAEPREGDDCVCPDGEYEDEETGECVVCSEACLTCTTYTDCGSCPDPMYNREDFSPCDCKEGYYSDGSVWC